MRLLQSRIVNLPHQDPVDRFLVATSMVFDLTLVTADERLLNCESLVTLANKSVRKPPPPPSG
jgi:PIN domain nuclease of toxin-antitoxin system